jgi:HAD superfamily hydrolase (TIGR01490 family)
MPSLAHVSTWDRLMPWRTMGGVEAAFFDLDKTVISKSSSLALSRPFYRAGLVTRSQLLRGAYAQLVYLALGADEKRMAKAKDGMLALTKGWNRTQVEEVVRQALEDVVDPYLYQEALDLIALHRALGRRVFIVSSAPQEVVRPLAGRIGVEDVIATRAEIRDGRYTGNLEFYAYREQKAEAMRQLAEDEGIDLSRSYAYSDSITDRPMLEAVGNPVAVNPDRELRRLAQQRGWKIRDFRRPVRLRQRFPEFRRPSPAAVAVAVALAAAVLAWVYLRARDARSDPA